MSMQEIGKLVDKWMNDGEFRKQVRKDPEGTIRKNGVKFTEEEWKALRELDWSLSDEELKSRVTKAFG